MAENQTVDPIEAYLNGSGTNEPQFAEQTSVEQPQDTEVETTTDEATEVVTDEPEVPVQEEEEIIMEDDEQPSVTEPDSPFAKAKEVLGFEVKSLDDIKTVLSQKEQEFNTKLESLKEANTLVQSDELRDLVSHVQKGGKVADFKDAEAEISNLEAQKQNLSKVEPKVAYRAYLKEDLGLNDDEIEDYLATKADIEISLEGKKLIKEWENQMTSQINEKRNHIETVKAKQTEKYNSLVTGIRNTIESTKAVLGVSVTPSDKQMLSKLAEQPLKTLSQFFPVDEQGNYVAEVWTKNLALLALANKKADVLKRKASSDGARQVIEGRTNIQRPKSPTQNNKPELDALSAVVNDYLNS